MTTTMQTPLTGRPSTFGTPEQEGHLKTAQSLKNSIESANLHLLRNVETFKSFKLDEDDTGDLSMNRDPAILAAEVVAQTTFLRKLKFQYIEQNAKDRYVKSIVSDIDDAPIVTADDNKQLLSSNAAKKEKLKVAKSNLAARQSDIRSLAPLVESDYHKVVAACTQATTLAQQILDARLSLTRLRKTHPHPRLTVSLADQKLADQVTEMQELSDELKGINAQVQSVKEAVKKSSLEVERLRAERAEIERTLKMTRGVDDDPRLVPLYSWITASTSLHRSLSNLHECYAASKNELRLTYNVDPEPKQPPRKTPHRITITLIFQPETKLLASVTTAGLEELGVDIGDTIDTHLQANDVQGLITAILGRVRTRHVDM